MYVAFSSEEGTFRSLNPTLIFYSVSLREMPEKFDSLIASESFLEATNLLVTSMEHMDGDLRGVEGLSDIRETVKKRSDVSS